MSQYSYRPRAGGTPDVIFLLLVTNVVIFALLNANLNIPFGYLALWSVGSGQFFPWQLITYGFLHADLYHILFNMFALWMFGRDLVYVMGTQRFLLYYLVCVAGAGLIQLLVAWLMGEYYPTVGASGGVYGVLLGYGLFFPNRTILLLFPPIPLKAKYLVILVGIFELYVGISGSMPGVANFAHLGGMLFGFLLIRRWQRRR